MADFPDEIIAEILLCLPSTSLVRFRCVSQSWNTLITSQSFVKSYLERSQMCRSVALFRYRGPGFSGLGIWSPSKHGFCRSHPSFRPPKVDSYQLVDSYNGILCLSASCRDNASDIYLWNPAIREFVALPRPRFQVSNAIGFGFNPHSGHVDDFRVVNINGCFYDEDLGCFQRSARAEIYSLRGNSWKQIDRDLPPWYSHYLGRQVIYKEFICWCSNPRESHLSTWLLVCFDVVKEVFNETALPENIPFGEKYVASLDGCVSVAGHESNKVYGVWIMKEFGVSESWTKLYRIELLEDLEVHYKLLGYVGANELVYVMNRHLGVPESPPTYVASYNLDSEKFVKCDTVDSSCANISCLVNYVESLVSLRLGRISSFGS